MESLPYELQDKIIKEIYKRNLPKIDVKTFDKYYMTNSNIILKKLEQICNYRPLNKKSLENQEKKLKDIYLSWLLMYYGDESTKPKSILGSNKANLFSEVMRELNKYWTNKNVQDNLCYIYQSMEFKDNNNKLTSNGKICLKYMLNFITEYHSDFNTVDIRIINYLYIETKKNIIKMYNNRQINIKKVNEINKKLHLLFTKWNNIPISDGEEKRDSLDNFLKNLSIYWTNDNIKHYYCTIIKSIQWKDANGNMSKYVLFGIGEEEVFELMLSILGLYNNKNLIKKKVFNNILLKTVSENRKKICNFLYEDISNVAFGN